MTVYPRRALIIGGGVAGPVLALFFKRSGFDAEVFEASSGPSDTGGALSLAANGMNVLAAAGVIEPVRDVSVTADEWAFENQHGKLLVCMPSGDPVRYGQAPVLITRAALHRVIAGRAGNQGIAVKNNKRLITIDDLPNRAIVAHFADGSSAEGDFIVGADGIRSQVRQVVMPEAPKPVYTGMMAPGGFSPSIGDASYGLHAQTSEPTSSSARPVSSATSTQSLPRGRAHVGGAQPPLPSRAKRKWPPPPKPDCNNASSPSTATGRTRSRN